MSPDVVRSSRPMGSENVQGSTSASHTIERADGSSCNPTTSAPTGPMVAQKLWLCEFGYDIWVWNATYVPDTVPVRIAKKIRTP
jgi:hypothetical protein